MDVRLASDDVLLRECDRRNLIMGGCVWARCGSALLQRPSFVFQWLARYRDPTEVVAEYRVEANSASTRAHATVVIAAGCWDADAARHIELFGAVREEFFSRVLRAQYVDVVALLEELVPAVFKDVPRQGDAPGWSVSYK